jgi:general secretion pathway protein D
MFDGQTASVIDQATRPFVMGLTPVVGDFAVAQQPIIVMLNDGTQLNVQSVVSPDKRFVRMTLSPQFTRIEDAGNTFTFEGTRTSRSGSTVLDPGGNPLNERDDVEDIVTGSTVQLPTLGVTTINTTVTVPDGGTILLGGIKRLSEGRVERGVPILSKVPYINRLFKNVGVGRTTNTLMMTVSPRIIIPEEEEANLTGNLP